MATWRIVDTGLRRAAENIALNRALLEARQQGESPSTLRFLRFTPCALLGYHQSAAQELNLDYCLDHGISRYQSGQAQYQNKLRLGSKLTANAMYFRHRNPLLQRLLRLVSPLFSTDEVDA